LSTCTRAISQVCAGCLSTAPRVQLFRAVAVDGCWHLVVGGRDCGEVVLEVLRRSRPETRRAVSIGGTSAVLALLAVGRPSPTLEPWHVQLMGSASEGGGGGGP
jgi:hypothetical protein